MESSVKSFSADPAASDGYGDSAVQSRTETESSLTPPPGNNAQNGTRTAADPAQMARLRSLLVSHLTDKENGAGGADPPRLEALLDILYSLTNPAEHAPAQTAPSTVNEAAFPASPEIAAETVPAMAALVTPFPAPVAQVPPLVADQVPQAVDGEESPFPILEFSQKKRALEEDGAVMQAAPASEMEATPAFHAPIEAAAHPASDTHAAKTPADESSADSGNRAETYPPVTIVRHEATAQETPANVFHAPAPLPEAVPEASSFSLPTDSLPAFAREDSAPAPLPEVSAGKDMESAASPVEAKHPAKPGSEAQFLPPIAPTMKAAADREGAVAAPAEDGKRAVAGMAVTQARPGSPANVVVFSLVTDKSNASLEIPLLPNLNLITVEQHAEEIVLKIHLTLS